MTEESAVAGLVGFVTLSGGVVFLTVSLVQWVLSAALFRAGASS